MGPAEKGPCLPYSLLLMPSTTLANHMTTHVLEKLSILLLDACSGNFSGPPGSPFVPLQSALITAGRGIFSKHRSHHITLLCLETPNGLPVWPTSRGLAPASAFRLISEFLPGVHWTWLLPLTEPTGKYSGMWRQLEIHCSGIICTRDINKC